MHARERRVDLAAQDGTAALRGCSVADVFPDPSDDPEAAGLGVTGFVEVQLATLPTFPDEQTPTCADVAAKAKPDGQTIFVCSNTAAASNVALMKSLPYDPLKDFEPVTIIGRAPEMSVVGDTPMEFPRINYRRHHARPYRYAYGVGASMVGGDPVSTIARVDMDDGETWWWGAPGLFPGEPVFVPAPDGTAEDDGVLLSVVLDSSTGTSFLAVLDAHDLSELARAHAPHRIGFGFHGDFFSA